MIASILAIQTSAIITNFLDRLELEDKETAQSEILRFCNKICGERIHQHLANAVDEYLGSCLNFEKACVLYMENDNLFSLKIANEDTNEIETKVVEVPMDVGITGKCVNKSKMIISIYGKNDTYYNAYADNILKLKDIENIVVIPLFADYVHITSKKRDIKIVGVLQLINYKGNMAKLRMVRIDIK